MTILVERGDMTNAVSPYTSIPRVPKTRVPNPAPGCPLYPFTILQKVVIALLYGRFGNISNLPYANIIKKLHML